MFRTVVSCLMLALLLSACASPRERGPSPQALRIGEAFKRADTNGDEQLSREEFAKGFPAFAKAFDDIDVDHNGKINLAELQSYMEWSRVLAATDKERQTKRRGSGLP